MFRTDRGIARPQDLKGKRVGVTPKTKGEFFLARFLTLNGMDMREIQIVHLPPDQIVEALARGTLDAASIWEPFITEIKGRLPGKATSWPAQDELAFYYLLLGREQWVKEHPAAVVRFLAALVAAEEFVEKEPLAAQKLVAARYWYEPAFVQTI